MVYARMGWKIGFWGLSRVYTMPIWCCKLCKLIWYARILFGMLCGANWTRLEWVESVISEGICISRSGELGSPRRDWQRCIHYCHSSVSLRRREWVLSDKDSRLVEWGSLKRDSEGVARVERDFSSRRGFCGFERTRVSPKRDDLA